MGDWLSYSITDFIPFSRDSYLQLAVRYNARFTPAVLVGQMLGIAVLLLLWRANAWRLRLALAGFALSWLWIGWAYQIETLAPLLWAGDLLGMVFALQGGLLLAAAFLPFPGDEPPLMQRRAGFLLLFLAILVTPPIGLLADRDWSGLAWFGSAPDPTVVATLALAALLPARLLLLLIPVPLLWCLFSVVMKIGLDDPLWVVPAGGAAAASSFLLVGVFRFLVRQVRRLRA
jgi:hypothetical protein